MPRWNGGVIGAANNPTQSSAKGIWSLSEATKAARAGLWPPSNAGADPYFENVTMLLPGDGTNGAQNNTFLDSSTNNFTITRNGNTTQGTFSPFSKVDGRWGNYFDGNGDNIALPSNTALNVGTGDFTIEFWMYSTITSSSIFKLNNSSTSNGAMLSSSKFSWHKDGIGTILESPAIALNSWNHAAYVRSGTSFKLYVNGVNVATVTNSDSFDFSSWNIGMSFYDSALNGFVSNFRIVKGVAVYTGNFTPPTAPLAATQSSGTNISAITGTQTSLLTCQSNRFIDNSTNAFAITRNGDAAVTTFSPFPSLTAYAAGTNGGSAYFDEAGDYLATPTNAAFQLGTGDFSIEAWIYPTKTPAGQYPTIFRFDSGGYNGNGITFFWRRYNVASTGVSVDCGGVIGLSGTSTVPVGAWTHVAFTRTGNDFALFVNGVREATTNNSNNFSTNVPVNIGYSSGNSEFPGYISSARVVKGSNPYGVGTTLTIPTAPLTAITNTSLLLNFTNGGIVDAAMSNDLETVGNAQISTTQSKFGGASMYFDGTGDYLISRSSPVLAFGSGDFTIETWVYVSAHTNADGVICANWTGTWSANNWSLHSDHGSANEKFSFWVYNYSTSAPMLTSTTTVATGTWYHVAVTRSGSSWKLFVNGTQEGSTVTSSAAVDNGASWPVYVSGALSNQVLNGYLDDLRFTRGVARYTSNFTAPTGPFIGFGD